MRREVSSLILFVFFSTQSPHGLLAAEQSSRSSNRQEYIDLKTIEVRESPHDLVGIANTANEGLASQKQIESRPVYRPGELMEFMPGLMATQHSGEGKANQFYMRGINLDHGTDLRTTVDGMLVNNRSHAHGQGWTDLNFLIPELAGRMNYKKGPYFAEEGDFSSAGSVNISYVDTLSQGIAEAGGGSYGFGRALIADSPRLGQGNLLYAFEAFHNDGPFVRRDDYGKVNAVLKYSQSTPNDHFHATFMLHMGQWNSTDQIPLRAIDSGFLPSRYASMDTSDGGKTQRFSLSAGWQHNERDRTTKIDVYIIHNRLDLFSNFTYFLNDPVNGDQIGQPDRRTTLALNASHSIGGNLFDRKMVNTFGVQLQNDNIFNGLTQTQNRQLLSVAREDHIVENSAGIYWSNNMHWMDKFRTLAGLRGDFYQFDVGSNMSANSGKVADSIVSPKLSLAFGPWSGTEYYLSAGGGYRSNDARAATINVDPVSGMPADKARPLIRTWGYEAGVRTSILPGLQSSLSLFLLDIDSELIFQGDAGTTAAGRPSRRQGFESSNHYMLTRWLTLNANLAYARARFRDDQSEGNYIQGATERVAAAGATVDNLGPYFGALQWRHLGPRPLTEDNSVRSNSTSLLNGRIGYKISKDMRLMLEGFNLLGNQAEAISYYYTSRLPGEPLQGVADVHFHPVEPRSFRVRLVCNF